MINKRVHLFPVFGNKRFKSYLRLGSAMIYFLENGKKLDAEKINQKSA
jgi:hypothetical protein